MIQRFAGGNPTILYINLDHSLLPPSHAKPRYHSHSNPPAQPPLQRPQTPQNPVNKSLCVTMSKLSWLLTVYELAFLLFRVKEAAQVEDDGQKEHEAGHGDDRHRLLSREGTIEFLTPQSSSHIHLKRGKVPNATEAWAHNYRALLIRLTNVYCTVGFYILPLLLKRLEDSGAKSFIQLRKISCISDSKIFVTI